MCRLTGSTRSNASGQNHVHKIINLVYITDPIDSISKCVPRNAAGLTWRIGLLVIWIFWNSVVIWNGENCLHFRTGILVSFCWEHIHQNTVIFYEGYTKPEDESFQTKRYWNPSFINSVLTRSVLYFGYDFTRGLFDTKTLLVHAMAWCLLSAKPLPESMITNSMTHIRVNRTHIMFWSCFNFIS